MACTRALGTVDFGNTTATVRVDQSVGVYFGSFDPVHENHVAVARHAVERCGVGCVVFVASPSLQTKPGLTPLHVRVAMLRARLQDEAGMAVYVHGPTPLDLSLRNIANREAVCEHVDGLCRRACEAITTMSSDDDQGSPPPPIQRESCAVCADTSHADPQRRGHLCVHARDGRCAHQDHHRELSLLDAEESVSASWVCEPRQNISALTVLHDDSIDRSSISLQHTLSGDDKSSGCRPLGNQRRVECSDGVARSFEHADKKIRVGRCEQVGHEQVGHDDRTLHDVVRPPVFQLIGGDKVDAWAWTQLGVDRRGRRAPSYEGHGRCLALVFPRGRSDKMSATGGSSRPQGGKSDIHSHETAAAAAATTTTTTRQWMRTVTDYNDPHAGLSSTVVRRKLRAADTHDLLRGVDAHDLLGAADTHDLLRAVDTHGPRPPSDLEGPSPYSSYSSSPLDQLARDCGLHRAALEIALSHELYRQPETAVVSRHGQAAVASRASHTHQQSTCICVIL
jgi:hypothetical protein